MEEIKEGLKSLIDEHGIHVERVSHNGALVLSAMAGSGRDAWRLAKTYWDYSLEEAIHLFVEELACQ